MELMKEVERYYAIQQTLKELEKEKEVIRERLLGVVKAAGGRLVVGNFILSYTKVNRPRFAEVVSSLAAKYPEIAEEVETLKRHYSTTYEKLELEIIKS